MNNSNQALWYKLYVLCLPLGRLFDLGLPELVGKAITQISTLIMLIGMAGLILDGKVRFNNRTKHFLWLVVFMIVWSFLAAIILSTVVSSDLESPFFAILGPVIFNIFAALSVYYNYYNLTYNVSFSKLYKIFDIQIVILLIVGYLQLAAIAGMSDPYEILRKVFYLQETSFLVAVNRGVTLFGNEPSSIGIITFCVLPYIFTSISNTKGWHRIKYIIYVALFFVLFLESFSTETLILFIASTLLYVYYILDGKLSSFMFKASFVIGLASASSYLIDDSDYVSINDKSSFEYVLLEKAIDRSNISTAIRMSTVVNDLKIVSDYPLTGVGDGNQGYFYFENMPEWAAVTANAQAFMEDKTIVNGGGNFFPTFFSAYGLVGAIILLLFVKRYRKLYSTSILKDNPRVDFLYRCSIILILFSSWTVVALRETHLFIISLACVPSLNRERI